MRRGASDVVVVGGGPVGLAAAMYAVGSGLSVVVLEPRQGAIDKACGEGLMPGGVRALATLGIKPVGWDLLGIRYLRGGRQAEADFSGGRGRGVRRTELQTALGSAATAAGVEVLPLAACEVVQSPGEVHVRTQGPGERLDLMSMAATFWQLMACIRRRVARLVWRCAAVDHSALVSAGTTAYRRGAAMLRCTGAAMARRTSPLSGQISSGLPS